MLPLHVVRKEVRDRVFLRGSHDTIATAREAIVDDLKGKAEIDEEPDTFKGNKNPPWDLEIWLTEKVTKEKIIETLKDRGIGVEE